MNRLDAEIVVLAIVGSGVENLHEPRDSAWLACELQKPRHFRPLPAAVDLFDGAETHSRQVVTLTGNHARDEAVIGDLREFLPEDDSLRRRQRRRDLFRCMSQGESVELGASYEWRGGVSPWGAPGLLIALRIILPKNDLCSSGFAFAVFDLLSL